MRSSRVLARFVGGMALAEDAVWGDTGDRRRMSYYPEVRRAGKRCRAAASCRGTRFRPSRLEFSKEVSVGILKRMTLAISGLLLAGVAALAFGAAPAAAATSATAGSHVTMPAWHGDWGCGCWNDCWDDCWDDCDDWC
jgi:hypothetical protein